MDWVEGLQNEELVRRVGEDTKKAVEKKKISAYWTYYRVIEGKMESKIYKRRPRLESISKVMEDT